MKLDRPISLFAFALACLAAAAAPAAHAQSSSNTPPEGSLCRADETVVFACSSGRKQIAVCATPASDSPYGELHYRYGSERNLEVEFPTEPEPVPPRVFASGNRASNGAGGSLNYLRLNYGKTNYTVFAETSPGQGTTGYEHSGVLVENHGHTELHTCDGQAQAEALSDPKLIGKAVPVNEQAPNGFATYQQ